jgi:alkylation response protein AidB-like acyl-CoA dehydrogenase
VDFSHNEQRRMLEETATRFLRDNYPMKVRHEHAATAAGFSRDMWSRFAELGLVGALFREQHGGYGGTGFDIAVLFEVLGRSLVVEPFFAHLLGGSLLAQLRTPEQRGLMAGIIDGSRLLSLAHSEPQSRYDLADIATSATNDPQGGWRLQGNKAVVPNGDTAELLIVSARVYGAQTEPQGIGLFVVDAQTEGLERRGYATVDGGRAAEIVLNNVVLDRNAVLGRAGEAFAALEHTIGLATLALCAEALGAMQAATDTTLEYLRTRKQFGVTIGRFQALQHRYVDLMIEIEQVRSQLINAASSIDNGAPDCRWQLSAAKHLTGRVARLVAEECVQLHGGIAMTWEYELAHFAKRLVMIDHWLGDTDHHLERCVMLARDKA